MSNDKNIMKAFPLKITAFPGESLNLHIFEPRYKLMISECIDDQSPFAIMPYFRSDKIDVATMMEVTKVNHTYPGGEMDITVKAIKTVNVTRYYSILDDKPYPGIIWEEREQSFDCDLQKDAIIKELVIQLYNVLDVTDSKTNFKDDFTYTDIIHRVGFTDNQELHILSLKSDKERQDFIIEHLENMIPIMSEIDNIRHKAQLNGEYRALKGW